MKPASPTHRFPRTFGLAALLAFSGAATAQAQTAYGVNAAGDLFSFNLATPTDIKPIGNLGFTPEAIDFRPGTSTLYAFDVTGSQARLYTINTTTGAPAAIGAGFDDVGIGYDFSGATSFAFDFNPTTLQPDGSIRIRLVGNDGTNLRLRSDTGGIAVVDGAINGAVSSGLTGAAYTNSDVAVAPVGGSTALYYIDSVTNTLLLSPGPNGPNAGTVTTVGALEAELGLNVGFDIYSGASSNVAYVVNSTATNVAELYTVNLTTGAATPLGTIARNFTGGFAIDQLSAIPEPSSFAALAGLLGLGWTATRRRRTA